MKHQYHVMLVDDNEEEARRIASLLQPYVDSQRITLRIMNQLDLFDAYCEQCATSKDEEGIDILLMDIEFDRPDRTGIQSARRATELFPFVQVIYITGFIEYCTEVYETKHAYFLLKPVAEGLLRKAMDKAIDTLEETCGTPLIIKTKGIVHRLFPESITFVESNRRKALVHTLHATVETYAPLSLILEHLPGNFVQCHKSFLVNLDHVERFDSKAFSLRTGERIPISQARAKETRRAFFDRASALAR